MDLETSFYKSRAQGAYRFDPWTAEIDAMTHSAESLASLFSGIAALVKAAFRGIGRVVRALRQTAPVEVEPVEIARPADLSGVPSANDRAAA